MQIKIMRCMINNLAEAMQAVAEWDELDVWFNADNVDGRSQIYIVKNKQPSDKPKTFTLIYPDHKLIIYNLNTLNVEFLVEVLYLHYKSKTQQIANTITN